ncbi:putative ABC binding cassette transporter [Helicobacter phage Pt21299RU]|nr:putative ABC binding cassette transporter [Helicobacter phage Pt21299RU]
MRSWNYQHDNKNFKPKVWTNSMLLENGLLAILEALKKLENKSRSVILERLIIFFIETQKGQSDEKAWKRSKRAYKRSLVNKAQKNKLKRKQLERIAKTKKKKQLQSHSNCAFSYFERS